MIIDQLTVVSMPPGLGQFNEGGLAPTALSSKASAFREGDIYVSTND